MGKNPYLEYPYPEPIEPIESEDEFGYCQRLILLHHSILLLVLIIS